MSGFECDGRRLVAIGGLALATTVCACDGLLDIDHVVFGDAPGGATAGGAGAGGAGAGGSIVGQGGGGSGSGGDAGGAGGMAGAGGQGGDAPVAEDCQNGVDDNGDDLADCADPACQEAGYGCLPAVPDGWSGPLIQHQSASAPDACPQGWTEKVFAGKGALSAPPASCASCGCGAPSGAQCSSPHITFYDPKSCFLQQLKVVTVGQPGQCVELGVPGAPDSLQAAASQYVPGSGSCPPSGGEATVPGASFSNLVRLCQAPGGAGCQPAELCLPPAAAPYDTVRCIAQQGDVSCPKNESLYKQRTVYYQDVDDSRGCTPCSCADAKSVDCGATSQIWSGSGCGGPSVVVQHTGVCTQTSFDGSMKYSPKGPLGGSCSPQGGAPSGSASPASPVTVCCTQPQ